VLAIRRSIKNGWVAEQQKEGLEGWGSITGSLKSAEEVPMPTPNDALKDRLSRYREINITVTGRKSGRTISLPIWFVFDDDKLYLLPVQGSDTQWYKNVLKNPSIRIAARDGAADFKAVPITDTRQVSSVIGKFREKYGASDVKKYYSQFDVAVLAQPR
jgi:deazaflavin-dependent oxidoreductase (nitroreductase family)